MSDIEDFVLPAGYRTIYRFFLLPVRVAGETRFCENIRIIQRQITGSLPVFDYCWADVGFHDEVIDGLKRRQKNQDRDNLLWSEESC